LKRNPPNLRPLAWRTGVAMLPTWCWRVCVCWQSTCTTHTGWSGRGRWVWSHEEMLSSVVIVLFVLMALCAVVGAIYAYLYFTRINPRSFYYYFSNFTRINPAGKGHRAGLGPGSSGHHSGGGAGDASGRGRVMAMLSVDDDLFPGPGPGLRPVPGYRSSSRSTTSSRQEDQPPTSFYFARLDDVSALEQYAMRSTTRNRPSTPPSNTVTTTITTSAAAATTAIMTTIIAQPPFDTPVTTASVTLHWPSPEPVYFWFARFIAGSIIPLLLIQSNFLRAKAATALARLSHHNSVCLSVRLSVCYTDGLVLKILISRTVKHKFEESHPERGR